MRVLLIHSFLRPCNFGNNDGDDENDHDHDELFHGISWQRKRDRLITSHTIPWSAHHTKHCHAIPKIQPELIWIHRMEMWIYNLYTMQFYAIWKRSYNATWSCDPEDFMVFVKLLGLHYILNSLENMRLQKKKSYIPKRK